jgi:hypothetical protein
MATQKARGEKRRAAREPADGVDSDKALMPDSAKAIEPE